MCEDNIVLFLNDDFIELFGLSTESEIFLWSSSDFFLLGNSGKTQAGDTEGYWDDDYAEPDWSWWGDDPLVLRQRSDAKCPGDLQLMYSYS